MNIVSSKTWGMKIVAPLTKLNLSKIDAIALHHMAHPTAGIKEVEKWHLNNGWNAIGYNYWVGFDGTIYEGRGMNMGAGVANQNNHIISVGFQGNYQSGGNIALSPPMPDAQFNAGIDIIRWIQERVPTAKRVDQHGAFAATSCAGDKFPLAEMKSLRKRENNNIKEEEKMAKIVFVGGGKNIKAFVDGKEIGEGTLMEYNGKTAAFGVADLLRELGHEVEWKPE